MPANVIGRSVQFRTKSFVIPSLTFREVVAFTEDGNLDKLPSKGVGLRFPDLRTALVKVLHAALRHNYPDLTEDQVIDEIDADCVPRVVAALMGESGLEESGSGEAKT